MKGTLKQLKACHEIIETKVAGKGRIFNTAGDAFMVEFSNTLSAVNAAIAIQKKISEHNQRLLMHQKDFISAWALIWVMSWWTG